VFHRRGPAAAKLVPEAGARPWKNQCPVRRYMEIRMTMLGDESRKHIHRDGNWYHPQIYVAQQVNKK